MFNAIALSRGGFNECLNHVVDLRFQRRNRGSVGRRAARRHRAAGRQRCGSQLRAQPVRRHRRAGPGNGAMTVTRTPPDASARSRLRTMSLPSMRYFPSCASISVRPASFLQQLHGGSQADAHAAECARQHRQFVAAFDVELFGVDQVDFSVGCAVARLGTVVKEFNESIS